VCTHTTHTSKRERKGQERERERESVSQSAYPTDTNRLGALPRKQLGRDQREDKRHKRGVSPSASKKTQREMRVVVLLVINIVELYSSRLTEETITREQTRW